MGKPPKAVKTYLFAALSNEILRVAKDFRPMEDIDEYAESLSEEDFFAALDIKNRVDEVIETIKKMDDRYSTVLLFRYLEDMEPKRIAQMMGLSEKTIYSRLSRGREKLLEMLGEKK